MTDIKSGQAITASELAHLMLKWEEHTRIADDLGRRIKDAVLDQKKSVTVGDVRARYSRGRPGYDYETTVRLALEEEVDGVATLVEKHTEPVVNWSAVCKDAGLSPVVIRAPRPSVSLKLLASASERTSEQGLEQGPTQGLEQASEQKEGCEDG